MVPTATVHAAALIRGNFKRCNSALAQNRDKSRPPQVSVIRPRFSLQPCASTNRIVDGVVVVSAPRGTVLELSAPSLDRRKMGPINLFLGEPAIRRHRDEETVRRKSCTASL